MKQLETSNFYIIRYIKSTRFDARKSWTEDNTLTSVDTWYETFQTQTQAENINRIEELNGKIYLVQPIQT